MAIRINTNLASLNAQNNLSKTNSTLAKTLERLSSGLRINRAADDAAGLAVAEKLRTQVRGFAQASNNTQDATNLISTAESGIDQISSILQRMRELSIQSASDTLVNADRSKIQVEIDQLRDEITRIAENTEFNTRKLLDGSITQSTTNVSPDGEIKADMRIGDTSGSLLNFFATNTEFQPFYLLPIQSLDNDRITLWDQDSVGLNSFIATLSVAFEFKVVAYQNNSSSPVSAAIEVYNSVSGFLFSVDPNISSSFTDQGGLEGVAYGSVPGVNKAILQLSMIPPGAGAGTGDSIGQVSIAPGLTLSDIGKSAVIQIIGSRAPVTTDNALTFHVGANEGQTLRMGVQDLRAEALRVETLNLVGNNDNDSRLKAQNAIGVIDDALDYVNTTRARLGAYQNRLEYNLQNLQVARENLTASESRIRDADIAAETANLTRAQILVQAGTAVLTQANISPQSALNLLG